MSKLLIPVITTFWREPPSILQQWIAQLGRQSTHYAEAVPFVFANDMTDDNERLLIDAVKIGQLDEDNIILERCNVGPTKGLNECFRSLIRRGMFRYCATLDPDATISTDWLDNLALAALQCDESRVGMFSSQILRPSSQPVISSVGHSFRKGGDFVNVLMDEAANEPVLRQIREPFCPCTAAGMWSLEMLSQNGLADEGQFRMYNCVMMGYMGRLNGWSARFVPDAVAWHTPSAFATTPVNDRPLFKRGRLAIVSEFFPEPRRSTILDRLTDEQKEQLQLRSPCTSDDRRRSVFDAWHDIAYIDAGGIRHMFASA